MVDRVNLMLHRFSIYVQAYAIEVCRPEHEALALSLVTHKLYTDRSPIPHTYIYIYIFWKCSPLPAAILGQHGMGDRPHHRPSSWRLPCTGTYYFRANAQSIYLSNWTHISLTVYPNPNLVAACRELPGCLFTWLGIWKVYIFFTHQ